MSTAKTQVEVSYPEHDGDYFVHVRDAMGVVHRILARFVVQSGHWLVNGRQAGTLGKIELSEKDPELDVVAVEVVDWFDDRRFLILSNHCDNCRYRIAVVSRIAEFCPHRMLLCPQCDRCTCQG